MGAAWRTTARTGVATTLCDGRDPGCPVTGAAARRGQAVGRRSARTKPGPFLLDVTLVPDGVGAPDRYPFDLPAVRHLGTLALHSKVNLLVGENGAGKSALLEGVAVACRLNPEGGSPDFRFATRPSHSALGDHLRLGRPVHHPADSYFLRAETFYNVATEV